MATRPSHPFTHATTIAAVLGLSTVAYAQEAVTEGATLAPGLQLSLKLEPGIAAALTSPQADDTDLGQGHTVQLLFGLNRYLAVGPSIAYTRLSGDGMMDSASSLTFGAGARLMRPHDAGVIGISPWIDANALYVRTGDVDRPGFAFGTGVSMPLDNMRKYWLGPFARYSQVVDENRDAKILTFGLGLEVTSGLAPRRVVVTQTTAPIDPPIVPADRDGDGILDNVDLCPDVVGLADNSGCPAYKAVVVKREKLEVKETISFLWDSAKLEDSSYVALDEVVLALQDNRGFKVQIDGHASSEGTDAHNQTLSLQRADAVRDYLVSKGVASSRLISKGFSSSVPAQTNTTVVGRESNRRVEFILELIIVSEGNTP